MVRHLPGGDKWHPATDDLAGTHVYGDPSKGIASASAWSIKFDDKDFDEFLFATGDETQWLIAAKDEVIGEYYANAARTITRSSLVNEPHQVRWYRPQSGTNPEDPWISLKDHASSVQGDKSEFMLYGENNATLFVNALPARGGANVFIRDSRGQKAICRSIDRGAQSIGKIARGRS